MNYIHCSSQRQEENAGIREEILMDDEKLFTLIYEKAQGDTEYKRRESEISELGRKIMANLGENKELFLQYEKLVNLQESFTLEFAYQIGLIDRQAE